jgi:LmbE family N-acetylglucosaminyl deacetylase
MSYLNDYSTQVKQRLKSEARRCIFLIIATFIFAAPVVQAQAPRTYNTAELRLLLERLNVTGSVLHIAAHPDDENTALLAYLANERKLRTGYLSITRGDGGQNLIGTERGASLGIIRTQELLAARRIDGAEQFFTRAVDFGFSKNPEETLRIWNRDAVLADVVWTIRRFRPDVVITRFPTTGEGGHGHHTASAILAVEAFRLAGDKTKFTEQLRYVQTWQPRRIVWNAFRPNPAGGQPTNPQDSEQRIAVDVGTYNAVLGKSYTEIAADSRSMHKSQGFGSAERRGTARNYFTHIAGDAATRDLLDGIDATWARYPNGASVGRLVAEALREFNPTQPETILPVLIKAHDELARLAENDSLLATKRDELIEAIKACAGLWTDAISTQAAATPGGEITINTTLVKRSSARIRLTNITLPFSKTPTSANLELGDNIPATQKHTLTLPADLTPSQPYWLRDTPPGAALARVDDQLLRGLADNSPPLTVRYDLEFGEHRIPLTVPVLHRTIDPVRGEQYTPLTIAPTVTVNFDEGVYVFARDATKRIRISLRSFAANQSGTLRLRLPQGWQATPTEVPIELSTNGAEQSAEFEVKRTSVSARSGTLGVELVDKTLNTTTRTNPTVQPRGLTRIAYEHIPVQTLFPVAETRLIPVELQPRRSRIGYVMGAGDEIPQALRQIGYTVQLLTDAEIEAGDFKDFDSIVIGIRAYNTRPRLGQNQMRLMEYVKAGGMLIVQYMTSGENLPADLGPFPFRISRERVTVEEAPVTFDSADKLMMFPNRITQEDFAGWVQERGLYFAG